MASIKINPTKKDLGGKYGKRNYISSPLYGFELPLPGQNGANDDLRVVLE